MEFQNLSRILPFLIALFLISCESKPRVIESASPSGTAATGEVGHVHEPLVTDAPTNEHKVVVKEVLNTDRYTYLNVTENDQEFWVAVSKQDVEVGETCYFRGGILKKNFFSQEFNRMFETVYLVSEFWKQSTGESAMARMQGGTPDLEVGNIEPAAGAVRISELIANKEKYQNQVVKITGKCIKVNPKIMNRNWVHLADGSGDGIELTVTTNENIPIGAVVTLEGTIALDKDFGAGYRYDIIMEQAVLQ